MADPKAKYRLHAKRVDRLAIVDRPAVPDAEMVAYKRFNGKPEEEISFKGILDKDYDEFVKSVEKQVSQVSGFMNACIYKMVNASVEALNWTLFDVLYMSSTENPKKEVQKVIDEFEKVVVETIMPLGSVSKAEGEKISTEDIQNNVKRSLAFNAIYESFNVLSNTLYFVASNQGEFENPIESAKSVIMEFKNFVMTNMQAVISKSFEERSKEKPVFEKAGRTISSGRLRQLKETVTILTDMISDTEERYNKSKESEGIEMDEKMKQEISEMLAPVSKSIEAITDVLKGQGHLLNEDEQKEFNKKKEEVQVEISKKEEEAKAEKAKEQEEIDKKAKEAEEAEKAFKEEVKGNIANLQKSVDEFSGVMESLSKRLGIKKSQDSNDDGNEPKEKRDPFADVCRGK
jgi:hypothetical protein